MVEDCNRTPSNLQIHTGLTKPKRGKLQPEVRNQSARPIILPKGMIICEIESAEIVEYTTDKKSGHQLL